ncbi:hypothetical protein [Streptomyces tremellae]|uniref:PE-PGRS family protein n=1 Tax=Streptomyces tremellae TaxID=1124239 RepID=A0ABP7FHV1_9ACTN
MKTAFPYPILAGGVALTVSKVWVDNIPLSLGLINDHERVVALHSAKRDWQEIRIHTSVTVNAEELTSGAWESVTCVVSLRNSSTNLRLAFPLRAEAPGTWRGEIEIRRGEHVGRAEIDALVVAEVDGVAGRLIGRADDRWTADLQAKQPTRDKTVRMVWRDFGRHPYLSQVRDDPWMLAAEADEPVLYLNSSVEGLRALLQGPSSGEHRAVREVMATQIAAEAWTAMFNTALYAADTEEDEVQWPGGWREEVLRRMLPDFFPDYSPAEALAELVTRRREGVSGPDLHARLMHAAGVQARRQRTVVNTARALGRVADARGEG